jgi:hypothetical protein
MAVCIPLAVSIPDGSLTPLTEAQRESGISAAEAGASGETQKNMCLFRFIGFYYNKYTRATSKYTPAVRVPNIQCVYKINKFMQSYYCIIRSTIAIKELDSALN